METLKPMLLGRTQQQITLQKSMLRIYLYPQSLAQGTQKDDPVCYNDGFSHQKKTKRERLREHL